MNKSLKALILLLLLLIASNLIGCNKILKDGVTTKPNNLNQISETSPVKNNFSQEGQIRNNKLIIDTKSIHQFWEDPVFNNFNETGKTPKDYEKSLIDEAKDKGIDSTKLMDALKATKPLIGDKVTAYPVVIDTAKYNDKDSFIIVFTWAPTAINGEPKTVKPLGHIFVVAIEADSKKIIAQEICK